MIHKLKRKFILMATGFMFLLMMTLVLAMNVVNYCGVISESDQVLDVLSQPDSPFLNDRQSAKKPEKVDAYVPQGMSPEIPYESRFFVARVSADGKIIQSDLSRIVSVDDNLANSYIDRALKGKNDRGSIGQFRFLRTDGEDGTTILFLDCGRRLDAFRDFLLISIIVGLLGCIGVFIAFTLTAGKIVAPIAESYEKQKRFISDAGHEIKTPLTIIHANVDLLEMEGEKEELGEIRMQVNRLNELTEHLVMLSKMEEAEQALRKTEIPLSEIVSETASEFRAPAVSCHLELSVQVMPNITINGSADAIHQMVSLLLENAVKYSPEGSEVILALKVYHRKVFLSITNPTKEMVDEKNLPHVFDRFYRTDPSRNSQTGGHGIGLSIARTIVCAHGGSISAQTRTGRDFSILVVLPQ